MHLLFSQQALREAEEDLQVTQKILDEAKDRLREVEDGIATLQAKYRNCIAKKEELEMKCELCEQRLGRADKVRDRAKFRRQFHGKHAFGIFLTSNETFAGGSWG